MPPVLRNSRREVMGPPVDKLRYCHIPTDNFRGFLVASSTMRFMTAPVAPSQSDIVGVFSHNGRARMAESRLPDIIRANESEILSDWIGHQMQSFATRRDLLSEIDLQRESREFLTAISRAAATGGVIDISSPHYAALRDFLHQLSTSRARQGFSPSE